MQADAIHSIPNATTANSSMDQDAAAHRLNSVRIFAFGGVGFAGTPSQGEVAYNAILSAPKGHAIDLLLHAWQAGTPEAKAYALTGMKHLSDYQFHQLATEARTSKQSVITMHGCIVSKTTLAQIAADLLNTQASRSIDPHGSHNFRQFDLSLRM